MTKPMTDARCSKCAMAMTPMCPNCAYEERTNLVDTIVACLNAAGWDGTLQSLNDRGQKPSHYIKEEIHRLQEDNERLRKANYIPNELDLRHKYERARELLKQWVEWRKRDVADPGNIANPSPFDKTRAFLDGEDK